MTELTAQQITFDVFAGKASPLQQTLLAEWLKPDAHRELYFGWLEEWERRHPQVLLDTDAAFERLLAGRKAELPQLTVRPPAGRVFRLPTRLFWLVAAGVALVLLVGAYLTRDRLFYEHYRTAYGERQVIQLGDGSRVTLNANSALRVPRFGFGRGTREVWLAGEGQFSVRHLPGHQRFVVRTPDQLEVRVLGTEFVLYSRARGSKVVLQRGRVQVRLNEPGLKTRSLLMVPGDVVTRRSGQALALRHQQPLLPHTAWQEHRFVLTNTTVAEVAYQLGEQFGVRVELADTALANRRLGGTFRAETADELLHVLANVLAARLTRPGPQTYRLSPID